MYMARGATSTVLVPIGGASKSLRTTVPMWIIKQFNLDAGSKLNWRIDIEGDEMLIKVSPVEK
jgi:hypothetical protein|tara:strand:- start:462 stop:650 length:189 start_codon:yes stop_codon:yes gene_type:complete